MGQLVSFTVLQSLVHYGVSLPRLRVLLHHSFDVEVPFRVFFDLAADVADGVLEVLVDDLYFDAGFGADFGIKLIGGFVRKVSID